MTRIYDFLWATFNYRNKGMAWYRRPLVGWSFMKIHNQSRREAKGGKHSGK